MERIKNAVEGKIGSVQMLMGKYNFYLFSCNGILAVYSSLFFYKQVITVTAVMAEVLVMSVMN